MGVAGILEQQVCPQEVPCWNWPQVMEQGYGQPNVNDTQALVTSFLSYHALLISACISNSNLMAGQDLELPWLCMLLHRAARCISLP